MPHQHHHAVVVGAGIAGLSTAQALSRHFAHVTVVERDRLPADRRDRPGLQRGDRPHLLFERGQMALDHLLPGFTAELVELGAVEIDVASDVRWEHGRDRPIRRVGSRRALSATSRLVEWHLRRRVRESAGITVMEGRAASGLLPGWDGRRVSGVRLRRGDGESGTSAALRADLVVDAAGRRSPLAAWLEQIGFGRPDEVSSEPWLTYASRLYRLSGRHRRWKAAFVHDQHHGTGRAGAAVEVEGGRLLVALQALGGDHLAGHETGFNNFARSLRNPLVFEAIRDAEPSTPITIYSGAGARRRLGERSYRWPERLLTVGDSAWTYTPIGDQGVTGAALTAARLDEVLRHRGARSLDGLASAFRADVAAAARAAAGELPAGRRDGLVAGVGRSVDVLEADDGPEQRVVVPLVG